MKHKQRKSKSKKFKVTQKLVIGIILIGSLVYTGLKLLPKATPVGINEVSLAPSGTTTLSLPSTLDVKLNQPTSADISIDTGSSTVTAVQVELLYDPTAISQISVVQGDFLGFKLSSPKIENGKITFAYSVKIEDKSKSGKGVLATIKFTPIKAQSQISFGKETMAASINSPNNVLKSAIGTTISTSESKGSQDLTPPVLTDITPAPPSQTISTVTPAQKSQGTTTTAKTNNDRTFNESGNFDYSKRPVTSELDSDLTELGTPKVSGFAKFMQFIKNLFKGNNEEI